MKKYFKKILFITSFSKKLYILMKQAVKFTQYIVKIFKHLKKSTMASVIRKTINIRCHNKPFY